MQGLHQGIRHPPSRHFEFRSDCKSAAEGKVGNPLTGRHWAFPCLSPQCACPAWCPSGAPLLSHPRQRQLKRFRNIHCDTRCASNTPPLFSRLHKPPNPVPFRQTFAHIPLRLFSRLADLVPKGPDRSALDPTPQRSAAVASNSFTHEPPYTQQSWAFSARRRTTATTATALLSSAAARRVTRRLPRATHVRRTTRQRMLTAN
jgi:hypothetical protein